MASKPLRVTVLLSGSGTTFDAIHTASLRPAGRYTVSHVVSDVPGAFGLSRAEAAGCTTRVVDYAGFDRRADFNTALLNTVQQCSPDLVVLAGFMRIVDPDFVRAFDGRLLNIHPSLLPAYPGLNTYQRALDAGESEHGSTVHFVNDVLDGGPLIAQAVVKIDKNDTPETLSSRVQEAERTLYPAVIGWFAEGRLELRRGEVWLDSARLEHPIRGTVKSNNEEYEFNVCA